MEPDGFDWEAMRQEVRARMDSRTFWQRFWVYHTVYLRHRNGSRRFSIGFGYPTRETARLNGPAARFILWVPTGLSERLLPFGFRFMSKKSQATLEKERRGR